jgi:Na+/melibiose symporter-like transporter
MQMVVRVLATLLVAGGIIWILQGINVLPGSFMTGQIQWAYRGTVATVAGLVILLITFRRRKRTR